jgi:hypothetical protein
MLPKFLRSDNWQELGTIPFILVLLGSLVFPFALLVVCGEGGFLLPNLVLRASGMPQPGMVKK